MKALLIAALSIFVYTNTLTAQVGIGTVSPTSELEIEGTDTGIPALELNPQSAPVGDAMGQLAVIGDLLYMYDDARDKWLSVESTALQFGNESSISSNNLFFGGELQNNGSGPQMPFDGTIVYLTVQTSNSTSRRMDIRINGSNVGNNADPTLDAQFNLSSGTFSFSQFNIDFDAEDYISLNVNSNGSDPEDTAAIIWVKWRQ